MKTITKDELQQKIKLHKKWINDEDGGERLVLIGYDLSRADLSRAYLYGADLRGANLRGAYLSGAYLSGADLRGANIDFSGLDLACRHTMIHLDIEQIRQLLYTVYMQECEDPEYAKIRSRIAPYVKRWSGLDRHDLREKFEEVSK